MAAKEVSCPNPWNLSIYYLTRKRGLFRRNFGREYCDGDIVPYRLGLSNEITQVLKSREPFQARVSE